MNNDFSEQLLAKIEAEHIRPVPRWLILSRRGLLWFVLALAFLCAGVLCSLLLLASFNIDLAFLRASSLGGILRLLLAYIPLVWVGLLVLFAVIEILLLRQTARLYRHSLITLIGLVLLGVSVIGIGLYVSHVPERVQVSMERGLPPPFRGPFVPGRPLPRPEDGVLFGRVTAVHDDSFELIGPNQDRWTVTRAPSLSFPLPPVDGGVLAEGRIKAYMQFEATRLRPHDAPPSPPPVR